MAQSVPIDTREITVTPVFKHVTVEDVPASEREGHAVMKTMEVVEVRFAGSKLYSPVFPVDAMWKREGNKVITYMERWADQYLAFVNGNEQTASGTPLEMLKPYGITASQLSLCRVLKIYSIEALHHLEGPNLKTLQMHANSLKKMAADYMAERANGNANAAELEELRRKVAALEAREASPQEVETALAAADAEARVANDRFDAMDEAALKAFIKDKTGQAPRGTPSREWLLNTARELPAA
ncbi:FIG00792335: hypothetical protein [Devosia sp. DBB001]|nr:FIG00792335: hypothetical protein [Devosia sp. DBB001]